MMLIVTTVVVKNIEAGKSFTQGCLIGATEIML